MQNKLLSVLLATACITCGVRAEDATSTSPAPAAQATAPSSAPAPTPIPTQAAPAVTQAAPAPSQVIYSPRLPTAAELTSIATAQGLSVQQITETSAQITAVYKNNAGTLTTIAYQLLPTGNVPATAATVVAPSAPPTVVYETSPRVVYYRSYDPYYYDPFWPRYYPPVSLSLGFGYYRGGWGGGHSHHWR